MMIKKWIFVGTILGSFLGLSSIGGLTACLSQAPEAPNKANILASVDGVPVYVEDFNDRLLQQRLENPDGSGFMTNTQAQRSALLEDMINRTLLMREADKHNVFVGTDDVEVAFERSRSGWSDEEFQEILSKHNLTQAELKADLRELLVISRYFSDQVFSRIAVTDEEIAKHIDSMPDELARPEKVRAQHIVVKSSDEAKKIRKEIQRGLSFDEAATKYSLSPEGRSGGDLGFFARGEMPKVFEDACFELKVGEMSKVVESEYGFHLFKLLEKEKREDLDGNMLSRRIEKMLRHKKENQAQQDKVQALRKNAKIIIHEKIFTQLH
ncbi:peptidylprolyl isomerase [Myxococcota bacterium]|nr:peptidylprolyl isomerase [Myxococcota bacterium]